MANGVFIHREDSRYKDTPAHRYHFPKQYLGRAQQCVGDWIVYYEPVKVRNSKGYWAMARVERIEPDPDSPGMYYAIIDTSSFVEFGANIPFTTDGVPIEQGLLNDAGAISGRAQAAVRPLSRQDFIRIANAGLDATNDDLLPRDETMTKDQRVREEPMPFDFGERDRVALLTSRISRDRAFRKKVLTAYGERCALTGLKLINGGGRAEVQAAHIQPVERNGPDILTNGLALSGTVHWMFDRGLVSLADDLTILVSRHVNDRQSIEGLLNRSGRATVPQVASEQPHPQFLKWHRDHCFKQ